MPATKVTCPHCRKHLKSSKPFQAGHRVVCSRCGHSFAVPGDIVASADKPSPQPAAPVGRNPAHAEAAPEGAVPTPVSNRQMLGIGLVLGGLLLLLMTTLSLVLYFALHKGSTDVSVEEAAVSAASGEGNTSAENPREDAEQAPWLPPEEQEQVNKAIDRGVQWLMNSQQPSGSWSDGFYPIGLAALPALTLLECGVPPDDRHIQKALHHVRQAMPHLDQTYLLSLAILFLDRLGNPADKKAIQTCALRLVAGQTAAGGWTYPCPILTPQEENDLLLVMRQRRPRNALDLFTGGPGGSAPPGFLTRDSREPLDKDIQGEASGDSKLLPEGDTQRWDGKPLDKDLPSPEEANRALDRLSSELRELPSLQPPQESHKLPSHDNSDNSNTQFAILGLLAAGRYDLPLERTYALIVQRFHVSQVNDGRWNYKYSLPPHPGELRPAMTGAGLLGLAVQYGLAADHARKRNKPFRIDDPAVDKGFQYLSQFIGNPIGWKKPRARNRETINLYLLWTIERCGVLYHQRLIGGKDWYKWGVELLVDHQQDDGSWNNDGYFTPPDVAPITDTCFALLFLKRANLAKDLTKKLEFFMEGKKLHTSP
jgi:hypothetical protein